MAVRRNKGATSGTCGRPAEFSALVARINRFSNHPCMPPRSTITMSLRIDPRVYDRLARWAQRDGRSLNAAALESLECALDAYDSVEAEQNPTSAK